MIPKKTVFELAKALEGVPILGTLSGTPAARAGIRYGDILLSVNGRRTRTLGDYVEAKALRDDGMSVVVFRTGSEKLEELSYDADAPAPNPAAILAQVATMRLAGGSEDALDDEVSDAKISS